MSYLKFSPFLKKNHICIKHTLSGRVLYFYSSGKHQKTVLTPIGIERLKERIEFSIFSQGKLMIKLINRSILFKSL